LPFNSGDRWAVGSTSTTGIDPELAYPPVPDQGVPPYLLPVQGPPPLRLLLAVSTLVVFSLATSAVAEVGAVLAAPLEWH
jgi:hypothetical protein